MRAWHKSILILLVLLLAPISDGLAQMPLRSPRVSKRTLLNGLPVWIVEQHQMPTVAAVVMIRSGATFDPLTKGGLANMTAEMLKAGTQQRTRQQIARELETQGLTIRTQVDWDATYIIGQGPAKETHRILDLVADLILNPAFPESEFKEFKALRLEELKQQKSDAALLADQVFNQKLFAGTTYARTPLGSPQTVESITLGDIKEFYRKFYLPNNAVLAVVGDSNSATLLQLAGRKVGAWVKDDVPPFTFLAPRAPGATKVYLIDRPDLPQAQVRVGHLGIARDNDDYFPFRLLGQVFDGRGESGRLSARLRKKGYTGPVETLLEPRRMAGPFVVALSPTAEQVPGVITETIAAIKQMKEGISAKELEDAQRALVSQYSAHIQTPDQLAMRLLENDLYQLGSNYIDVYEQRVQRVTPEDLRRVAERYFDPGGEIVVVVGNAAALKAPLQAFGPVTVLSAADAE